MQVGIHSAPLHCCLLGYIIMQRGGSRCAAARLPASWCPNGGMPGHRQPAAMTEGRRFFNVQTAVRPGSHAVGACHSRPWLGVPHHGGRHPPPLPPLQRPRGHLKVPVEGLLARHAFCTGQLALSRHARSGR